MKNTIRKPAALLSVTFEERVKWRTCDVPPASRTHSPRVGLTGGKHRVTCGTLHALSYCPPTYEERGPVKFLKGSQYSTWGICFNSPSVFTFRLSERPAEKGWLLALASWSTERRSPFLFTACIAHAPQISTCDRTPDGRCQEWCWHCSWKTLQHLPKHCMGCWISTSSLKSVFVRLQSMALLTQRNKKNKLQACIVSVFQEALFWV